MPRQYKNFPLEGLLPTFKWTFGIFSIVTIASIVSIGIIALIALSGLFPASILPWVLLALCCTAITALFAVLLYNGTKRLSDWAHAHHIGEMCEKCNTEDEKVIEGCKNKTVVRNGLMFISSSVTVALSVISFLATGAGIFLMLDFASAVLLVSVVLGPLAMLFSSFPMVSCAFIALQVISFATLVSQISITLPLVGAFVVAPWMFLALGLGIGVVAVLSVVGTFIIAGIIEKTQKVELKSATQEFDRHVRAVQNQEGGRSNPLLQQGHGSSQQQANVGGGDRQEDANAVLKQQKKRKLLLEAKKLKSENDEAERLLQSNVQLQN